MSDVGIALDRELDEMIELLEGKRTLDFLAVPVYYSDDAATRRQKCEEAARAQGFRLDQISTLVIIQKFAPGDIESGEAGEVGEVDEDMLRISRELMGELEEVTGPGNGGI